MAKNIYFRVKGRFVGHPAAYLRGKDENMWICDFGLETELYITIFWFDVHVYAFWKSKCQLSMC